MPNTKWCTSTSISWILAELKLTITSQHADGKTTSFNYEGPVEGLKGAEKIIDKVVGDD